VILLLPIGLSLSETMASSTALFGTTAFSLLAYLYLTWKKVLTNEERVWFNSMTPYSKRRPASSSV
jgi:hypothetical protein